MGLRPGTTITRNVTETFGCDSVIRISGSCRQEDVRTREEFDTEEFWSHLLR